MKLPTILLPFLTLNNAEAFQIISNHNVGSSTMQQQNNHHNSKLQSTPNESNEEQPQQELVLGKELSDGLQSIGSEAGYLAAAKKRSEEARAKMYEQIRLEEERAESIRKDREENGPVNNAGPGDMSSWQGFADDGFDASAADGQDGGWGEIQVVGADGSISNGEAGGADGGEEQKLFLFGDEEDTSGSGLIL